MTVTADGVSLPKLGEEQNGDALVIRIEGDAALLAVVDALGHGPCAAEAARCAVGLLEEVELASSPADVLRCLHDALRGSRGAAATICCVRGSRLDGCGVGNVQMRAYGAQVPIVSSPGILGSSVRSYREFSCDLAGSARIILYSDGIAFRRFDDKRESSVWEMCRRVMDRCRRDHDDATILAADVFL